MILDRDPVFGARVKFRGRGKESGVEVDRTTFYVLTIRDGILVPVRPFDTYEEAVVEAGGDSSHNQR